MEKKFFEVRFEGIQGGPWISVLERTPRWALSVVFEEEEVVWILELLKKTVELKANLGFIWKFRGRSRTHLMEICFSSRGRFIRISEFVTGRKATFFIVPEGFKGRGWEALMKSISSVVDRHGFVDFGAVKVKAVNKFVGRSRDRSYAKVVDENGPRRGALSPVGKWAIAVICEGREAVEDWGVASKALARLLGVKGVISITPFTTSKGIFFVDSVEKA